MATELQAFLMLLDGVDVAFWSNEDAKDALSSLHPHTTTHVGLDVPRTTTAVDLKSGMLDASGGSFVIKDVDATLAALFAAVRDGTDYLSGASVMPTDTATGYESKHIGTEAISEFGERRQYPALPVSGDYGQFHPSPQITDIIGQASVSVDDGASLFAGRRVGLYRFTKPRFPGATWSTNAPTTLGADSLVWWGTLRDSGSVQGRQWKLRADGPGSLLRRQINQSSFTTGQLIQGNLALKDSEKWIGCAFSVLAFDSDGGELFEYGYSDASQRTITDTPLGVAEAMSSVFETARDFDNTSESGVFTDQSGGAHGYASFGDTGGKIGEVLVGMSGGTGTDFDANYTDAYVKVHMVAHEQCWRAIGYDPLTASDWDHSDDRQVYFEEVTSFRGVTLPGATSGAYYKALFTSWPTAINRDQTPVEADLGKQNDRLHRPSSGTVGGVHILRTDLGAGQIIELRESDEAAMMPQYDHPIASTDGQALGSAYQIDGANCTAQRAMMLYGVFRALGGEDERDIGQVGRCSWVETSDGVISAGSGLYPQIALTAWHDPRLYGIRNGYLEGEWASNVDPDNGVRVIPLTHIGFAADSWDNRGDVGLSLMLGSGSSTGWWETSSHSTRAYGPGGTLAPGQNNKGSAGALGSTVLDRAAPDFALDIPRDLVADRSTWEQLVGELPVSLAGVKVAFAGPMRGDEILERLFAPVGWCMTLRGGKYTPMRPTRVFSPGDADVVLTVEDLRGTPGGTDIPSQELRHRTAIDRIDVAWRWDPFREEHWGEVSINSTDPGARYRTGAAVTKIDASWERFDTGPDKQDFRDWWDQIFRWWGRRHFQVSGLDLLQRTDMWPGTVVQLTDPWLVSQTGVYGVTKAVGIVTSVVQQWEKGITSIDLMVQEPPSAGYRILAPEAMAYEYDSGTYTLTCFKDHRGVGGGHSDVAAFAQPSWSTSAAAGADIKVLQYIRGTLYQTLTGTISSVDSDAGTITLDGALSGTYYRDMESIVLLREFANQSAAWVKEVFAPIADEDGAVDGSTTDAVRFNDA